MSEIITDVLPVINLIHFDLINQGEQLNVSYIVNSSIVPCLLFPSSLYYTYCGSVFCMVTLFTWCLVA